MNALIPKFHEFWNEIIQKQIKNESIEPNRLDSKTSH